MPRRVASHGIACLNVAIVVPVSDGIDRIIELLTATLRAHVRGDGAGSRLGAHVLGVGSAASSVLPSRRRLDRVLEQYARRRLGEPIDEAWLQRCRAEALDALNHAAPPARLGQTIVLGCWSERTIGDHDGRGSLLRRLAATQMPGGAFLATSPEDSPDAFWFDELAILHAATSAAIEHGDATLLAAARRAASFHFAETQPDHATTLPLGIHAFGLDPRHVGFAEGLLHALFVHSPRGPGETALLLLADALHWLSVLRRERHEPGIAAR